MVQAGPPEFGGRCAATEGDQGIAVSLGDPGVSGAKEPIGASFSGSLLPPDEVLFGHSAVMQRIRQRIAKVAATPIAILIEGDSGTGKELLARWVHARSSVSAGRFVKVNCAAIPGNLLESELFGYEKGAFTGAVQQKPGRVDLANDATLFLDEITEIDYGLQAKLLQFLQDGHFCRIGGSTELTVNTRVICSSSRSLEREIDKGKFRADLFYRINVIRIELPRLNERAEDVVSIANHLLEQINSRFERQAPPFSTRTLQELQNYHWPGNIRELENRVARYVLLGDDGGEFGQPLRRAVQLPALRGTPGAPIQLKRIAKQACTELGREIILRTLKANHWNRRRTAEELKISYRALLYKIREAGLSSKSGRGAENQANGAKAREWNPAD